MRNKGENSARHIELGRISMLPIFFIHSFRKKSRAQNSRFPRNLPHADPSQVDPLDRSSSAETDDGNNRRAIFEHTRVFGLAGADREKAEGSAARKRPPSPPPFFETPSSP